MRDRCPHVYEFASPQGGIHKGRCVKNAGRHRRHRDSYGNQWKGKDRLWAELPLPRRKRQGWAA